MTPQEEIEFIAECAWEARIKKDVQTVQDFTKDPCFNQISEQGRDIIYCLIGLVCHIDKQRQEIHMNY